MEPSAALGALEVGPRDPAGSVRCTSRFPRSCDRSLLSVLRADDATSQTFPHSQVPPRASQPTPSPVSRDRRMALQYLADSNGWLSFAHSTPTLFVTAEDEDFDVETLRAWRDEGFHVKYVPMGKGGKTYVSTLHQLGDGMGIGERYAIVGTAPSSLSTVQPRRPRVSASFPASSTAAPAARH